MITLLIIILFAIVGLLFYPRIKMKRRANRLHREYIARIREKNLVV